MDSVTKWKWSMKNNVQIEDIAALVKDAKDDPIAFDRLYNHYVQPVYRYLYSRVGTARDAEDLTSQTFMAAFEYLPRYRESGQFAAWLFRIARSKLMNHFRSHRREVELDAAKDIASDEDTLGHLIQDDELNCLKSLIAKLDPGELDLIRLRYVAELTFAEIADLLGKREEAVKQSVYRLLTRLKRQME